MCVPACVRRRKVGDWADPLDESPAVGGEMALRALELFWGGFHAEAPTMRSSDCGNEKKGSSGDVFKEQGLQEYAHPTMLKLCVKTYRKYK